MWMDSRHTKNSLGKMLKKRKLMHMSTESEGHANKKTKCDTQSEPLDLCTHQAEVNVSSEHDMKCDTKVASTGGGFVLVGLTLVPYVWRGGQQFLSVPVLKYGACLLSSTLKPNMQTNCLKSAQNTVTCNSPQVTTAGALAVSQATVQATPPESNCLNHLCFCAGINFTFKQNTQLIPLKMLTQIYPGIVSVMRVLAGNLKPPDPRKQNVSYNMDLQKNKFVD